MTNDVSLAHLEARHDAERADARHRLEAAEELLAHYRYQIDRIRDDFHPHAARQGVSDDPGFRSGFQRVSEFAEENIRSATHVIGEFEEEFRSLTTQHDEERERFLAVQCQQ